MMRILSGSPVAVVLLAAVACGGDPWPEGADPFADRVVAFEPGAFAGFGEQDLVLGGPVGQGPDAGSLHVLSLGLEGSITLEMTDWVIVDEDGPDLIVFENPFPGWVEPGLVEVSADGTDWRAFPCEANDPAGVHAGCAGIGPVRANVLRDDPDAEPLDPTDPEQAGGDAFDLADVGLDRARFVRITDAGAAPDWSYAGESGGFDLDAVAVVNGDVPLD